VPVAARLEQVQAQQRSSAPFLTRPAGSPASRLVGWWVNIRPEFMQLFCRGLITYKKFKLHWLSQELEQNWVKFTLL